MDDPHLRTPVQTMTTLTSQNQVGFHLPRVQRQAMRRTLGD